jgi:Ion channel
VITSGYTYTNGTCGSDDADCEPNTKMCNYLKNNWAIEIDTNGRITSNVITRDSSLESMIYTWHNFGNSLYFAITTFTTLGYGDLSPKSIWDKWVASVEVFLGYVVLGLVLSVLAEKIARRS